MEVIDGAGEASSNALVVYTEADNLNQSNNKRSRTEIEEQNDKLVHDLFNTAHNSLPVASTSSASTTSAPTVVPQLHKSLEKTIYGIYKSICETFRYDFSFFLKVEDTRQSFLKHIKDGPLCVTELSGSRETIKNVVAKILDTPFDFIIGRPDIKKYNVLAKNMSQFRVKSNDLEPLLHPFYEVEYAPARGVDLSRVVQAGCSTINTLYHKDELLTPEYDDDGLVLRDNDLSWLDVEGTDNSVDLDSKKGDSPPHTLVQVEGSPELQAQIRDLLEEYKHIFSEELRPEAAKLNPMSIGIDKDKWQTNKNSLPPRPQSRARQDEVAKQIQKMLDAKVIKVSQAPWYSQVHLTPKPNGKWRFCIDYRRLNDCSESKGWPIPNVYRMLQRLGSKKAKFYAVMDLTSGYHQAPLSMSSQSASAFTTDIGTFEWLRVPIGLKGAPSYFQAEMAQTVLGGLTHNILELYLDDIIVHGGSEAEYMKNLRQVFDRLRKFNITLSPRKCRFGMEEVEYVGHVINADGMTFSEKKRGEVLDFPMPQTHKGMKQFLGLINYFRDHIENHSIITQPLQAMVTSYSKNKPLKWTPDLIATFRDVREKVANCPKLHFLDEKLPLFLHTDASDYGIGAYLFQKSADGKELPIAFISKSLTAERLRWSVPEKEAFAIVYAFQKLEYVLRDMFFTLRTDHKNLLYINDDGSAKVKRWKLQIQEYNFDIEHIAGEENVAADAFSRLCERAPTVPKFNGFAEPLSSKVKSVLKRVHNSVGGHSGVDKTIQKLTVSGVEPWPRMREHVTQFIQQCPTCQKLDYRSVKNHTTPFSLASNEPMQHLSIDTIGPMTEDQFGNKFILVVIDQFTRFVELYATKEVTAKCAAQALVHQIGRYGAPESIRSDNGTQLVNETIGELLELVGSEHRLSLPDSKEENGIVERANKEVMRHLRALTLDLKSTSDWSVYLPLVQRIMNASVHSSIGMSPAQLLFGNAVTLDRGIFLPHKRGYTSNEESEVSFSEWADKMRDQQARLIEIARKNQSETDALKIAKKNPERTEFPVNSYVLVKYRDRPPTKFHSNWRGPMRVVNFDKSSYVLQDLVTLKVKTFHLTQLKEFKFDEMEVDPVAVALAEQQAYLVESVLAHRKPHGSKRRTDYEFLVKWVGYDEEKDNTWEPWEFVRNNEQLLIYLYENNLRQFLTKEQKCDVEAIIAQRDKTRH